MGLSKNSLLALVCFAILAMVHSSLAQNSPQDYLNAHNTVRAQVGVGPMTWDNNVAAFAQNYVNQRVGDCALIYSGGGRKYGENIATGSGNFTGAMAVGLWAEEEPYYVYNSNSCARGRVCGHYTQIVWENSVWLGCARARCNSGLWFITCNYDPPGNFVGQRPYGFGSQNSPQEYLNAHNTVRAQVGVGPMTWDPNVAAFAQNYANQRADDCAMIHSGGDGKYGENIAAGSGDFTGAMAVGLWAGENPYYDYNSNSCAFGKVCKHYTQIVWETSVRLGCARVRCNSGSWFITCNYDPPGNFVGQRPYNVGAQNSPQDYLNAHNNVRAQVGVGPMTWDPNVAAFAQNYANQRADDCAMIHSDVDGKYGENIATGNDNFTGAMAVGLWAAEKPYYDYNSNSCAPGRVCGHYTQIVWKNSVRLGCARVRCSSGLWFVTCNYDPPGNFVGQRPYGFGELFIVCDGK